MDEATGIHDPGEHQSLSWNYARRELLMCRSVTIAHETNFLGSGQQRTLVHGEYNTTVHHKSEEAILTGADTIVETPVFVSRHVTLILHVAPTGK